PLLCQRPGHVTAAGSLPGGAARAQEVARVVTVLAAGPGLGRRRDEVLEEALAVHAGLAVVLGVGVVPRGHLAVLGLRVQVGPPGRGARAGDGDAAPGVGPTRGRDRRRRVHVGQLAELVHVAVEQPRPHRRVEAPGRLAIQVLLHEISPFALRKLRYPATRTA